ncbi:dTDP-4-amino-4,6-dideoxygalactose transaminase [Amycolatopsis marina]|uniref:dTDP-4-amino-4,6-dideoxygalactose transaminase n=1 Tax=Amycolatopsis marina TaxID=490629 RepID=A0A1I1CAY0_9PSEU|nr:DegT/DnrJ/EryC1/StrS family aminotransferase [Amycolatopsis marina]SFB59136.1 dTDP-4-amino-4,6-dideoxygalactose transaminase [Amycolatopsis marina]
MTSALALLGGTPTVTTPEPHFTWPPVTSSTVEAVRRQLGDAISIYDRSGVIADLEDALADYFGVRHVVLTSSGTTALHSLYAACGIGPGDEVIVPAYTFFATVTPLLHLGAIPVLAECDETGNLNPEDVLRRITPKTTAIMATHLWGLPADMHALKVLADEHQLLLLEDGSHAHGASIDGQRVGTFGHAAAFSMNGPKPLSAGEGGFVLTDNQDVFHRVLLHGQYNKRCRNELPTAHPLYRYAVTGMGLKFRIHPLAARIALEQLDHLNDYLDGRARVAAHLHEQLAELPGITVPQPPLRVRSAWYGLPLRYHQRELGGLPPERFHQALQAEGCHEVDRPGSTCPLNLLPLFQAPGALFPAYVGRLGYAPGDFPVAEELHRNTLKLPVWHREEDMPLVDQYIEGIRKVTEHHRDLQG